MESVVVYNILCAKSRRLRVKIHFSVAHCGHLGPFSVVSSVKYINKHSINIVMFDDICIQLIV